MIVGGIGIELENKKLEPFNFDENTYTYAEWWNIAKAVKTKPMWKKFFVLNGLPEASVGMLDAWEHFGLVFGGLMVRNGVVHPPSKAGITVINNAARDTPKWATS